MAQEEVGTGGYDDSLARQIADQVASLVAAAAANNSDKDQQAIKGFIDAAISRLTIAGPGVTGSARTGWAINTPATSAGSEETEDYYVVINGTLYTQTFVVSGPPVVV